MKYVPLHTALNEVELAHDWNPSNTVPSFEKVWAYYVEIDDQWREDHIVEDLAARLEDDPSPYDRDAAEAVTEIAEELADPDQDAEETWDEALRIFVEQEAKEQYEENYWEAVSIVKYLPDHDCWRVMTLPERIDPAAVDPLGRYWSFEEDIMGGGQSDFDRTEGQVRYRARIDDVNIDKEYTVLLNTEPGRVEWEAEVRMLEGTQIFVYDVELADGTILPINDWRDTSDVQGVPEAGGWQ